jgi:dihydroorotase
VSPGCAGIFTGHAALALYAEAFESLQALDRLEGELGMRAVRRSRMP